MWHLAYLGQTLSYCVLLCVAALLNGCREGKYEKVATFVLPHDRQLIIFVERDWEGTQGYYYEVRQGGRAVIPLSHLVGRGRRDPRPEFDLATAQDGDLAAVTTRADPDKVLILHDFKTGFSYPRHSDWREEPPREEGLLRIFQAEHPEHHYQLSLYGTNRGRAVQEAKTGSRTNAEAGDSTTRPDGHDDP